MKLPTLSLKLFTSSAPTTKGSHSHLSSDPKDMDVATGAAPSSTETPSQGQHLLKRSAGSSGVQVPKGGAGTSETGPSSATIATPSFQQDSQQPPCKKIKLHISTANLVPPPHVEIHAQFFTTALDIFDKVCQKTMENETVPIISILFPTSSSQNELKTIRYKLTKKHIRSFAELSRDMIILLDGLKQSLGSTGTTPGSQVPTNENEKEEIKPMDNLARTDSIKLKKLETLQKYFLDLVEDAQKELSKYSEEEARLFFDYIRRRQVTKVERLVRLYPSLLHHYGDSRDALKDEKFTWTPLHSACFYGLDKLVKLFLDLGADVEAEDTLKKNRALGWAAFAGYPEICKLLVQEYDADPWAKNKDGHGAFSLVPDPTNHRWTGIWTMRPDQENADISHSQHANVQQQQEGFKVKVIAADSRKKSSKVLLKVPTLGKREEELELEEFVQDLEQSYTVVKPKKKAPPVVNTSPGRTASAPIQKSSSSRASNAHSTIHPPLSTALSYSPSPIDQKNIVQSLGLVSNDESVRSVLELDPEFYGTSLTVSPHVQSLSLRLALTREQEEQSFFAAGLSYRPRPELISFRPSKAGLIQDTHLMLQDGLNVFEIKILAGKLNTEEEVTRNRMYLEFVEGTEQGQAFLLLIYR